MLEQTLLVAPQKHPWLEGSIRKRNCTISSFSRPRACEMVLLYKWVTKWEMKAHVGWIGGLASSVAFKDSGPITHIPQLSVMRRRRKKSCLIQGWWAVGLGALCGEEVGLDSSEGGGRWGGEGRSRLVVGDAALGLPGACEGYRVRVNE